MFFRKKDNVTFYSNAHPKGLGCAGIPQCECPYHVVDDTEIYSFDSFQDAQEKYMELTGEPRIDDLIINKT